MMRQLTTQIDDNNDIGAAEYVDPQPADYDASRTPRGWQRVFAAVLCVTLFFSPVSITYQQSESAAGILAAGSTRRSVADWEALLARISLPVRLPAGFALRNFDIKLGLRSAGAATITDPSAPVAFQPQITQSTGSNGSVPVVNITAPNAAGISLNQYQRFDIDAAGLILNNSLRSGTSLTGGDVAANPNLAGRTASVIINQVTSNGAGYASVLAGPLEVFGAPATVIIANPNGISTRGVAFTNTIGVTLATGVPQFVSDLNGTRSDFANATQVGYSISGGHIQIEGNTGTNGPGAGIDGTVGTIDLIGETIGVNAPLYAGNRIDAIAGRQFVMPASTTIAASGYAVSANGSDNSASATNAAIDAANAVSANGAVHGLSIDATAFGAMTAGAIQVISTAAGMGVRTDAKLAANTSDLVLSANGDLTVAGTAAQQQASLSSSGDVVMSASHVGVAGYAIAASASVASTGTLQSGGALTVSAGSDITLASTQTNGDATLTSGRNISLGDAQIGGALQAIAQQKLTLGGTVQSGGNTSLTATQDALALNGTVSSGGDLALLSGGNTTIAGQTTAQAAASAHSGADLIVSGSLTSGTTVDAHAIGAITIPGSLLVGTNATLNAGDAITVAGMMIAQQDGAITAGSGLAVTGSIAFGQNGSLHAVGDIVLPGTVLANALQVDAGGAVQFGTLQVGGAFGAIAEGRTGLGDITFSGNAAVVGSSDVSAAHDVVVSGTFAGGDRTSMVAQQDLTIASDATVQSVGALTLTAKNGDVQSTGNVNSAAALNVTAGHAIGVTGTTTAVGDVDLEAGTDLNIGGTLAGQGKATLHAGQDVIAAGSTGFASDATVSAGRDLSVTGSLQADAMHLHAGRSVTLQNVQANAGLDATTDGGGIQVNGNVLSAADSTLHASGDVNVAASGAVQAAGALTVTGGGNTTIAGNASSNGDMTLTNAAGGIVDVGTIAAGGNLAISAAQSIDLGTQSTSALGDLAVMAGQDLVFDGTIVVQGKGTLQAGTAGNGGAIGGGGSLAVGGDAILLATRAITSTGSIRGGTVTVTSGGATSLQDVQSGSAMTLQSGDALTLNGKLSTGDALSATADGNLLVNGAIQAGSDAALASQHGDVSIAAGGTLAGSGQVALNAGQDIHVDGSLTSAGNASLQATRDVSAIGSVQGQGSGNVRAGRNLTGSGTLSFTQAASLRAEGDINQGGLVQGQSVDLSAAGNVSVNNVEAATTLALRAGDTTNGIGALSVAGTAVAGGAVTASASQDINVSGKIASGTTLAMRAVSDITIPGALESVGGMTVTSQAGSLLATGGINSGASLFVTTGLDLTTGVSTTALGQTALQAGRDLGLNGVVVGQAAGTLQAGRDISGAGTQSFDGDVTLSAQRDLALSGSIQANGVQATAAGNATLHDVTSATSLTVVAQGSTDGAGGSAGSVTSAGGTIGTLSGDVDITGTAKAATGVAIAAARDTTVGGSLSSGTTLGIAATRTINVSGRLQSTSAMQLTARTGDVVTSGAATVSTNDALSVNAGNDATLAGQIDATQQVDVEAGRDITVGSVGTGAATPSGTHLAGQATGTLNAGRDIKGDAALAFAQAATVAAGRDVALSGKLQGASATVTAVGNVAVGAVDATVGNASLQAQGGELSASGNISALEAVSLNAANDMRIAGTINSGTTTTIDAGGQAQLADISATGDLRAHAHGGSLTAGAITSNGGVTLISQGDMALSSAQSTAALSLQALGATAPGSAGDLSVTGVLSSATSISASAAEDLAVGGNIVSGGAADFSGARDVTLSGSTLGMGAGTITAGRNVQTGSLAFGESTTVTSGGNAVLGAIQGAGDVSLTAVGNLGSGAIIAVGALSAVAGQNSGAATNSAAVPGSLSVNGTIEAGSTVALNAAGSVTVAGATSAVGDVTANATQGSASLAGVSTNGNVTVTAGSAVVLSGTSTAVGNVALSGSDVTLTGSIGTSKALNVTAQNSLDVSGASLLSTGSTTLEGGDVKIGTALVGADLNAQANRSMSLTGGNIDVVGVTSLSAGTTLSNVGAVLSGGAMTITASTITNALGASLASTDALRLTAGSLSNAGLINGLTTTVTATGALTNAGSLLGVNGVTINAGTLNNNNGVIFSGDTGATSASTVTADLSINLTGTNTTYSNTSGQILAQRNLSLAANNGTVDTSLGSLQAGGALAITANTISNSGTWNYAAQSVTLTGLSGIVNTGTISGTAPLTLNTGGTFVNAGQLSGQVVTLNGALYNTGVLHTSSLFTLNGSGTNRGTVESVGDIAVTGSDYDNQYGTTQASGNLTVALSGTLSNTAGSIYAGNNVTITANTVVNDQAGPTGATTTSGATVVVNPSVLWSGNIGSLTVPTTWETTTNDGGGDSGSSSWSTSSTVGDLLSPTGSTHLVYNTGYSPCTTSCSIAGSSPTLASGVIYFQREYVSTGWDDNGNPTTGSFLYLDSSANGAVVGIALPTVYQTTTTQQLGVAGVISAGNSIALTANTLYNRGGQIAAQGNVTLNVQSLNNGAIAPSLTATTYTWINQSDYSSFLQQLASLRQIAARNENGNWNGPYNCQSDCGNGSDQAPATFSIDTGAAAPTGTGTTTWTTPTGMIAAGNNMTVSGGNLTNAGLLYAGNDVSVTAQSLTNQGGTQQNQAAQTGCASGVPNEGCGTAGAAKGSGPTTASFNYSQNATIYAGHDLVIAAGQINNTFGSLLAGHDLVVGGVGTTATSSTAAQSLNNTSGNIVAGNDITLNVSGAITNTLPPPVQISVNYGSTEAYAGCMTAGGYKDGYCTAYVDQQSGSSSVISAGNNLQINAGSLTNVGSLISAGTSATINVSGPVVNEAQTLNAYWHSHWIQQTGIFSSDKSHDTWACGSVAECTALYGDAYTKTQGSIDPPQPVGSIAATIQAPNLTINAGGTIQNVGNVLGTSISLTGQSLINGITSANTYTPRVNGTSQVISLNPTTLPSLNLSIPRSGAYTTSAVAGTASYVDAAIGTSTGFTPQDLINNLPSTLQPSTTLFYYNPQEEDLLLQQVALQQTGRASFIDGLSYDSKNNLSVTEQEKGILYQNALTYAQTNNLKLGDALSQTQIAALDKPMLWYVEQTVPDPSCTATGTSSCPTVTALMPQIYLPQDTSALAAGGTIAGSDVTLDFNKAGGTVLNTGTIAATDTLTVNTGTLTNRANQVDIGNDWTKVQGGYVDTTGTVVQPGGYMSAANYALNVEQLTQIGGSLSLLNPDGSANVAGTAALVAQLQQQLGSNFSQETVADALHTQFVQQGGVPSWFGVVAIAAAIVVSVLTYGAASSAVGAAAGATAGSTFAAATAATATSAAVSAGLGNIVISAAIAGIASSATSQLIMTGSIDASQLGQAALVSGITAGLLNGITYSGTDGLGFTTGTTVVGGAGPQSLASLAGLQNLSNAMSPSASGTSASVSTQLAAAAGGAVISAGVQTAVDGGSYLNALKGSLVSSAAAIGAYEIGELSQPGAAFEQGTAAYVLAHAALGCAAGAASGTGCEGGALGGATSAIITPLLVNAAGGAASLTSTQRAEIVGLATLLGGTSALLGGVSAIGGATSAQNEALNNSTLDHETEDEKEHSELKKLLDAEKARLGETPVTQNEDGTVTASGTAVLGAAGNTGTVKVGAAASKSAATSTTLINGVSVTNRASGEVYTGTVDLQPTLDRIASGGASISANDGTVFQNRPVGGIQLLPAQAADYYREYVVPTPGIKGPGPQRLVTGQGGEIYYTPDHYQSFIPVKN
ncbi:ribonuclease domain-containing protein [Robbsia sp. KACC 23696]|uniref:two-partner secretion domain-containing protein n=1 Tax=Robbsia sp. KACC 23696 TaxID=3149231 RepID=UPI00325B860E